MLQNKYKNDSRYNPHHIHIRTNLDNTDIPLLTTIGIELYSQIFAMNQVPPNFCHLQHSHSIDPENTQSIKQAQHGYTSLILVH